MLNWADERFGECACMRLPLAAHFVQRRGEHTRGAHSGICCAPICIRLPRQLEAGSIRLHTLQVGLLLHGERQSLGAGTSEAEKQQGREEAARGAAGESKC